jgi:hypothetical protein
MTTFSEELEWLEEYLILAKTVIPKIRRLKAVKIISPREGNLCRIYGALTHRSDGNYSMSLYVRYNSIVRIKPKVVFKRKVFSKVDILGTFAHELAHLMHWDHTPQHKMLEAKLTILFMAKLAESGYVSEEVENKNRRRIDAENLDRRKQ